MPISEISYSYMEHQGTEDERSYIIKEVTSSKLDLEFHLEEEGEENVLIYVYHFIKEK